jgi:hypothetical protein
MLWGKIAFGDIRFSDALTPHAEPNVEGPRSQVRESVGLGDLVGDAVQEALVRFLRPRKSIGCLTTSPVAEEGKGC